MGVYGLVIKKSRSEIVCFYDSSSIQTHYILLDNQPEQNCLSHPELQLLVSRDHPEAILLACPAYSHTRPLSNPTHTVGFGGGRRSTLTLEKVGNLLFADTPRQATQFNYGVELDNRLLAQNVLKVLVAGAEDYKVIKKKPNY